MLRSLGLGLGLETFAKFLWGFRFRFRENLSRKKSLGFGFGKNWSRKKVSVSVSEKIGIVKKSLSIGFGQNFGIVIQCFTRRTLSDERTPLAVAARNASKKMVSFLLSLDASPDKTSSDGSTAFSYAIKSKCITTINLLAPMRIPQVLYIN